MHIHPPGSETFNVLLPVDGSEALSETNARGGRESIARRPAARCDQAAPPRGYVQRK